MSVEQVLGLLLTTAILLLCMPLAAGAGERLYNGIRLESPWPPRRTLLDSEPPPPPPYLVAPPAVIPIDVGRQLFVDDFLIEETTLRRACHRAEYHPGNPVLKPDREWELRPYYLKQWEDGTKPFSSACAMPFSDGVWCDPADGLFKLWYMGGFCMDTCYATSRDGIHWDRPELDIVPGTNIVSASGFRDSAVVWMDLETADPDRRFVLAQHCVHSIRFSPDGIHWGEEHRLAGPAGDRSTLFYNPFRKVWVFSLRAADLGEGNTDDQRIGPGGSERVRWYWETPDLVEGGSYTGVKIYGILETADPDQGEPTFWVRADRLDPVICGTAGWGGDEHRYSGGEPMADIYNLDAVAYESLVLGFFSIFRGQPQDGSELNEVVLGYSRDGFHWHRPVREAFLPYSGRAGDWNRYNVQSAGGGCLVVGDKLYFYVSANAGEPGTPQAGMCSTGLAVLRRDGFASMQAAEREETLTTRPVQFSGRHLFVNADASEGELRVEVLDRRGRVIAPFSRDNCRPIKSDSTLQTVSWAGAEDLARLAGRPVRFRFHLRQGDLYAFWVSPDESGASHGYVAAGGPGFTGPTDTVGSAAYRQRP